jgi:hypothetical protein
MGGGGIAELLFVRIQTSKPCLRIPIVFCFPISPWRHKRHLFVSSVVIDPASFSLCVSHQETFLIFSLSLPVLCWKSFVSFYSPSYFLILDIIPIRKFNSLSICMLMYSSSVWHYYYCNQVILYSSNKSILPSLYRDGTKRPSEQQETVCSIQ